MHPNSICGSVFTLPITKCSDLEGPNFKCNVIGLCLEQSKYELFLPSCAEEGAAIPNESVKRIVGHAEFQCVEEFAFSIRTV